MLNWALHFGSQVGRNLILHMESHQEMAQRSAPTPFRRGSRGPETHALAISPSLGDKGMSQVKKIANGDPPPVDCLSTDSHGTMDRIVQWVLVASSNTMMLAAAGGRDSLEGPRNPALLRLFLGKH